MWISHVGNVKNFELNRFVGPDDRIVDLDDRFVGPDASFVRLDD